MFPNDFLIRMGLPPLQAQKNSALNGVAHGCIIPSVGDAGLCFTSPIQRTNTYIMSGYY